MIKINLLPHKKLKPLEKGLLKIRAGIVGLIVLVALGLLYGFYYTHSTISNLKEDNAKASKEYDALKAKVKEGEEYEKTRQDLETKLSLIRQLEKKKLPLTSLLNEINKSMSRDVWLTGLEEKGIAFTLTGYGKDSDKNVNGFVAKLKESPVFKDIALEDIKEVDPKSSPAAGIRTYTFKVSGKLAGYAEETAPAVADTVAGKGKKAPAGKKPAPDGKTPAGGKPAPSAPKSK